ncbi:MAG: hypothetical protein GY856_23990 [bacterium]|nr:hypothetical protein [bacterium]
MSHAESNLRSQLRQTLCSQAFPRKRVTLLLGTDEYIRHETRVALTPRHLAELREDLEACGLDLRLLAMSGAGIRADFSDREYEAVGAEIVKPSQLAGIEELDVLHALKEPTRYESEPPGPFLRIGALHLASYPPGVCELLAGKNFAAILDGGTIGNCSYLRNGGDRTPIVASMSRFAGAVAGRKLVAGLREKGAEAGKMVLVGGGIAGLSAIEKIAPLTTRLIVVEPHPETRARLVGELEGMGFSDFAIIPTLTDEAVTDAVGIVFAHRSGAKAAEKVCTIEQIRKMKKGSGVADIAIDQGGSILHDDYGEDDDAATCRKKYQQVLKDHFYYAETNMPREDPHDASEQHGNASLPYVTMLLALSALHGGPQEAMREILRREIRIFTSEDEIAGRSLVDCLVQDLRNGMQLATRDREVLITDPDIEKNKPLAEWVRTCAG